MAFTSVTYKGDGLTYSIPGEGDTGWAGALKVDAFLIALGTYGVTLSGTETLTNKTLTSPALTAPAFTTIVSAGATLTLPTSADTLVGRATTDTLTNKTLSGNTAVTLISGSGVLTLNTTGTITVPNGTDTLVGKATTDTLTNKTISGNTAVTLISGSGTLTLNTSGTVTLPNATDTLVGKATTDTLTNKSISGATNTLSAIPWTAVTLFTNSEVWLHTGAGYGSTNTFIRRFATAVTNTGTGITYADSAENGGSFTIATAGIYAISYTDFFSTGVRAIGVSCNSNQLTTNIESITAAHRLLAWYTGQGSATGIQAGSVITRLAANDVIRAHTDGGTAPSESTRTVFRIVRIA